jgi:hypothetical protein
MRSWISLLRTARAPFAVLVLCAVGLIFAITNSRHDGGADRRLWLASSWLFTLR